MSEVREIRDPDHPCRGQKGLFATKPWAPGRVIGEYQGLIRWFRDVEDTTYYAGFQAEGYYGYGVDASVSGNHTKYINDYKGVAPAPNVRYATTSGGSKRIRPRIMVITIREVQTGEEFVADYGYECTP